MKFIKALRPTVMQILAVAAVIVTFVVAYNLGAGSRPAVPENRGLAEAPGGETVWTCSMHPEIRMHEPGDCPLCGMELIPAAEVETPPADAEAELVGYACAMNCTNPLPEPGKCPICGMEMVAIYAEGGDDSSERQLVMSRAAKALADIQTTPVERRYVENEVRMVGEVDYDETRVKEISARVGGRLERMFVDYTGIRVAEGDHLVELYSPELLTTQDDLRLARQSLDSLPPDASATLRDSRENALESVRERLRLWGLTREQIRSIEEAGDRLDRITIYSPLGGIVIRKHAQEGEYVEEGETIYTVADLSQLWVRLKAYESDLPWLRYGQDVTFTVEAYPGRDFHGRITFIQPTLDPMTRTVDVRLIVDNEERLLKPEMYVRAVAKSRLARGGRVIEPELAGKWISPMHPQIIKDHPGTCDVCGMPLVQAEELGFIAAEEAEQPPLVIPRTAPLITGKRAVVYVEVPDTERPTYEGREIVLGPRAGEFYLVHDGLHEGERVVTHGAFKIDSALQIMARPSMMNPEGGAAPAEHDHGAIPAEMPAGHSHENGREMPAATQPAEAATLEVSEAFLASLTPLYESYFDVQVELAADRFAEAKGAYRELLSKLEALSLDPNAGHAYEVCNQYVADLKEAAKQGADAADIETARTAFQPLSNTFIDMEQALGHLSDAPFYQVHCPMAFDFTGADWLQTSKEVHNPYFGASMLQCGSVVNTFESAAAGRS